MTPDELASLPPAMAFKYLLDIMPPVILKKLEAIEAPQIPRVPKYDFKVFRKEGYQWASELDLKGLLFWQGLAQKSVDEGGKYADKDAKKVEALERWVVYRRVFPDGAATTIRGDNSGTGDPPSGSATVYPKSYTPIEPRDHEGYGEEDPNDDDIPF